MHCSELHFIRHTLVLLSRSSFCLQERVNYLKPGFRKVPETNHRNSSTWWSHFLSNGLRSGDEEFLPLCMDSSNHNHSSFQYASRWFFLWRTAVMPFWILHEVPNGEDGPAIEITLDKCFVWDEWIIQVLCNFTKPYVDFVVLHFTTRGTFVWTLCFGGVSRHKCFLILLHLLGLETIFWYDSSSHYTWYLSSKIQDTVSQVQTALHTPCLKIWWTGWLRKKYPLEIISHPLHELLCRGKHVRSLSQTMHQKPYMKCRGCLQ